MDKDEQIKIRAFHRIRLGNNPLRALGYRDQKSQLQRFETLRQWGDFSYSSVLDLGCGYGDLLPYLDKHFHAIEYLGIDLLSEFIDSAKLRFASHARTQFRQSDFFQHEIPEADIIIACGSLNYASKNPEHPWHIIERMWQACRKGLAFNLLDANYFSSDPILKAYDVGTIRHYCQQFDPHTRIIQAYLPDDFTVLMKKIRSST